MLDLPARPPCVLPPDLDRDGPDAQWLPEDLGDMPLGTAMSAWALDRGAIVALSEQNTDIREYVKKVCN